MVQAPVVFCECLYLLILCWGRSVSKISKICVCVCWWPINLLHFITNVNSWVCYSFQQFLIRIVTSLEGVNELPILYRCQIVPVCIQYYVIIRYSYDEAGNYTIIFNCHFESEQKNHPAISFQDDLTRKRERDFILLIQVQIDHHEHRGICAKFALGNNCHYRSLWNVNLIKPMLIETVSLTPMNHCVSSIHNSHSTAHRNPFACPNMTFMSAISTSYREATVRFQIIAIAVMKCRLIQTLCLAFI